MEHLSENPPNHTEGLILSSFEVLQNTSPEHQMENILSKGHALHPHFLDDFPEETNEPHRQHSSTSTSSSNSDNSINHQRQHSCPEDEDEEEDNCGEESGPVKREEEPAAGDEMFYVHSLNEEDTTQFRDDQALDALDQSHEFGEDGNSVDSNSRKFRGVGDDDDDEDEEGEEEDEDEEDEFDDEEIKDSSAGSSMQEGNIIQSNRLDPQVPSVHCAAATMSDLRGQPHFLQFPPGTLLTPSDGWPADNCYSSEWHLAVSHAGQDLSSTGASTHAPDMLTHELHRQVDETHGTGQHQQIQHNLWGVDAEASAKIIVGHNNWSASKEEDDEDIDEDLEDDEDEEECTNVQRLQQLHQRQQQQQHNLHRPVSGQWVTAQPQQVEIHPAWSKDIGAVFTGAPGLTGSQQLFTSQECQRSVPGPMSAEAAYAETPQAKPQTGLSPWALRTQLPTGPPIGAISRPVNSAQRVCSQQQQQQQHQLASAFYCPLSSQGAMATVQVHSPWPHAQGSVQVQPAVAAGAALEADRQGNIIPREHFHAGGLRQHAQMVRCKSQAHLEHQPMRSYGAADVWKHSKVRAALTQGRYQHHPYLMKEEKKLHKDIFPVAAGNIHSVKASHIVSWYIDYLIHENEHLTQISQAFSLPVNLFHSDDFYFMESLKKKVHFPSIKFLTWMQQHLPSININTVDFREGRPPSASSCTAQSQPAAVSGINSLHSASNSGNGPANTPASSCWGGGSFHHPHHMQHHQHHHHRHHQLQHPGQHHPLHKQHHKQQQQQQEMSSWQNKSRRDIIHDVFFYFQHRRVTCQN